MGLIIGLLTLPLAPVRAVVWLGEQVQTQVDRELTDPGAAASRLTDIETAWRAGEITDARRAELEEQVLQDLYGDETLGSGTHGRR